MKVKEYKENEMVTSLDTSEKPQITIGLDTSEKPQITIGLDKIYTQLDLVETATIRLENSIHDVLEPETEGEDMGNEKVGKALSPMAAILLTIAERLSAVHDRLKNINDRVEL